MPRDAVPVALVASRYRFLALYVALAAVVVAWFASGILAVDTYNHVTRLTVACSASDDPLRTMWAMQYGLIPNLAIDLINQPFCGLVAPERLMAFITAATVAAILALAWPLQKRLTGQNNILLLLLPGMMLNLVTFMGYTNYLIGLALAMAFACWLYARPIEQRSRAAILVAGNLAGMALFFCHVFAAMIGAILLGMRLVGQTPLRDRAALVRATLLAAAAYAAPIAMVLLAEKSGGIDVSINLLSKLRSLFGPFCYSSLNIAAAIVSAVLVLFYGLARERIAVVAPEHRRLLLVLLAVVLIVPTQIGDAVDIDARTIVFLAILALLAVVQLRPHAGAERAIMALGVAIVVLQLAVAFPQRQLLDRQVAELRTAARVLPPYAPLLSASLSQEEAIDLLHFHMASVVTPVAGTFNPLEFSGRGMQPMDATPAFACVNTSVGSPLDVSVLRRLTPAVLARQKKGLRRGLAYAADWRHEFPYVLLLHEGTPRTVASLGLQPIATGSFFTLYRNPAAPLNGAEGACPSPAAQQKAA